MRDFQFERKHLKMIDYLVCKYPSYLRDDLKQELLMKLYKLLIKKRSIFDIDHYIFISLKNCAIDFYKKEMSNKYLSLNQKIQNNYEMIDFIIDSSSTENSKPSLTIDELKLLTHKELTTQERNIFEEYFYYNVKQKDLAKEYDTTQQNISKIIKKALSKIKNHIK